LRLEAPNPRHVETLAQLNGSWPPILISAHDHCIIDGQYRFMAAKRLGLEHIECYLFHGDRDAAFLEALRLNCGQGLTLTIKERELAAGRLIEGHREWSDRRIGALCGLSPTTIGRLRLTIGPSPTVHSDQLDVRAGKDHRLRPLNGEAMRRRVITELRARPHASLREIASVAHCSPETVRSVRKSLVEEGWQARPPVLQPMRQPALQPVPDTGDASDPPHEGLDHAFVSTIEGAAFKRWFETTRVDEDEWRKFVMSVPLGRVYEIADAAMQRSTAWREFARALEARVRPARI
jgi:ParB-like chromosome segregation protein Spo0J